MITNQFLRVFGISLLVFLLFAGSASRACAEASPSMKRLTLLAQEVALPSNKITGKVIRVNFPVGFKTPRHTHDGPGPRYVVKGTLQVVEGESTGIYSEGDVFWESGKSMTVENVGGTPAELIIFELAP